MEEMGGERVVPTRKRPTISCEKEREGAFRGTKLSPPNRKCRATSSSSIARSLVDHPWHPTAGRRKKGREDHFGSESLWIHAGGAAIGEREGEGGEKEEAAMAGGRREAKGAMGPDLNGREPITTPN